jgi:NDP-4-keto-2,6-dideoxyhexose 3-C-methyltransferase
MELHYTYDMSNCVSCGGLLLEDLAIFGNQIPSAVYNQSPVDEAFLKASSLNLTICEDPFCALVQLSEPVDLTYVYEHYPYQTGTTATMSQELREFAASSISRMNLFPGDVILDIGGNDGTLLSNFSKSEQELINIDAASGVQQSFESENYTYLQSFFSADAYISLGKPKPKAIFSSAMFYQLSNPDKFCSDVASIMSSESVFFLQMTYLSSMYKNRIFDNVVHEHITYFSLFSLENLLKRHGLEVIDAQVIGLYGGTLRVAISKNDSGMSKNKESVDLVRNAELRDQVNSIDSLKKFGLDFELWKSEATEFLSSYIGPEKSLTGFGASTKGNMLLQSLGLSTREVSHILDNNPKKIGTWTTKTLIPILSELESPSLSSPILLLPYYYLESLSGAISKLANRDETVEIITLLPYPQSTKVSGIKC